MNGESRVQQLSHLLTDVKTAIAHIQPSLSRLLRHHVMCCAAAKRMIESPTGGRQRQKFRIGTSFFLNIMTVIDNIIIKKDKITFSVTGKVPPKACITFIRGV